MHVLRISFDEEECGSLQVIEKLERHWLRLEKEQKNFYEKQAEEVNKKSEIMKAVRQSRIKP